MEYNGGFDQTSKEGRESHRAESEDSKLASVTANDKRYIPFSSQGTPSKNTYLEVNNDQEHNHGGNQVEQVGGVLAIESLLESAEFVGLGDEQVEKSDDGSFELGSRLRADGHGGEPRPQDTLANVGGNKERDFRAETVTFLEELVQKNNNDSSRE